MKKLIIISLALATLLSGCSLISHGELDDQEELSKADQTLDDHQFNLATQSKDAEKCDLIMSEEIKSECVQTVEGFVITEQAKTELDKDMCGEIELDRYKENCVSEVEKKIEASEAMEKYEEGKLDDQELQLEASKAQDAEMCNEINITSMRDSCIYNIVANQAMVASDNGLCDQIEDEVMSEECRKNVSQDSIE